MDFLLVAGMHTLLNFSAAESGILDACEAADIAVLAAAPFNSGILAREAGDFDGAWYSYTAAPPALLARAKAIHAACAKHDVSLRLAALAFPLGHPAVVSVIVGAKSAAEWQDCVELMAAADTIPPAFWTTLREEKLVPEAAPLPGGA